MARVFTPNFKANVVAVSAKESPLAAIEIISDLLPDKIRLINDKKDLVSNNQNYIACPFTIQIPSDKKDELPRAELKISNIGRDIGKWIEQSLGAKGTQIRLIILRRSSPDDIEYDITTDVIRISLNPKEIAISLGFEDTLNRRAVHITYRPLWAPGLF